MITHLSKDEIQVTLPEGAYMPEIVGRDHLGFFQILYQGGPFGLGGWTEGIDGKPSEWQITHGLSNVIRLKRINEKNHD